MKDLIINASIESLRNEGLKFSVDMLANKLKISKKTIYKIFPSKEALALALYEKYYDNAENTAQMIINGNSPSARHELLRLYFDSKVMTRKDIFNKYKLNDKIYSYASEQNNNLWEIISASFGSKVPAQDMEAIRIIIDGAFEKLCTDNIYSNSVIERLVQLLW